MGKCLIYDLAFPMQDSVAQQPVDAFDAVAQRYRPRCPAGEPAEAQSVAANGSLTNVAQCAPARSMHEWHTALQQPRYDSSRLHGVGLLASLVAYKDQYRHRADTLALYPGPTH